MVCRIPGDARMWREEGYLGQMESQCEWVEFLLRRWDEERDLFFMNLVGGSFFGMGTQVWQISGEFFWKNLYSGWPESRLGRARKVAWAERDGERF